MVCAACRKPRARSVSFSKSIPVHPSSGDHMVLQLGNTSPGGLVLRRLPICRVGVWVLRMGELIAARAGNRALVIDAPGAELARVDVEPEADIETEPDAVAFAVAGVDRA